MFTCRLRQVRPVQHAPKVAAGLEIFGHVDNPQTVYVHLVPEDGLTWEY